jgi:large subunit ribosomal protein L25
LDNIINAKIRKTKGNSPARALRRSNKIPAVIYGPGSDTRMLSIEVHELEGVVKKGGLGSSVYNLMIDGNKKPTSVMIKELQRHPVSHDFLHVDFYEVAMDRKIRVNVPVVTTGKSIGVEQGGMVQIVRRELEVFCLPNEIPEVITIDITDIEIGGSVHVEDVKVPGDVEIPHDVNFTILTVSLTKAEVEEVEEEEEEEVVEGEEGETSEETE